MEERSSIWPIVLGAVALVAAIVALFIAISAKNGNTSDADLAKSVRAEIQNAVPQLKTALADQSKAIAVASARLHQAEHAQKKLAGGQAVNRGDINKLSSQITAVQGDVNNLTNDVNALKNEQNKTSDSVAALNTRVNKLETQIQQKKNK